MMTFLFLDWTVAELVTFQCRYYKIVRACHFCIHYHANLISVISLRSDIAWKHLGKWQDMCRPCLVPKKFRISAL